MSILKVGDVFETLNYGTLEVIEYGGYETVTVRFKRTGYTTKTRSADIRSGRVKDYLKPSVAGVGYTGVGPYSKTKTPKAYQVWQSMLARCYNTNNIGYRSSYRDCSVVPEWHNLQNFSAWFYNNYIEGYQLDKDIKIAGNKVYGPSTCMFVSQEDNVMHATGTLKEVYGLQDSSGNIHTFSKQAAFCTLHNLNPGALSKVIRGFRKSHKGWTLPQNIKEI